MSNEIQQQFAAVGVAQVIVVLKEGGARAAAELKPVGTSLAAAQGGAVKSLAGHFTTSELSQTSQMARTSNVAASLAGGRRRGKRFAQSYGAPESGARFYPNLGVLLGTVDPKGLAALRADSRVEAVAGAPQISLIRPNRRAGASGTGRLTWGLRAMRVQKLWKQGLTGRGVLVGHLDTGADGSHAVLKQAIRHFAAFDDFGREVRPTPAPFDTDDHGTHTAATIAGRPVKNRHVGVAHGAELASAIVIEGGDVVARVLGGMDWAVGLEVRILSMSLGFRGWWDDFLQLTRILRARNVLPVFAVGNEGAGTSRSPGNYPEALSVGAHDRSKRIPSWSSSQRFDRMQDPVVPDLVLPGVSVVSARPGGGYQTMDGTSMATPHMAGLAALLMEAYPSASIDDVESAVFSSCARPGSQPQDRANRGIPNAERALELLR